MVPTLSERLRRRAYECYSPRHIRVPWQVSPELPTALTSLAAVQLSTDTAVQLSAGAAVQPMSLAQLNRPLAQINQPLAQTSLPLAQINRPEPNQPQPISPRQIQDLSQLAGAGAVSASQPTGPQVPPSLEPPASQETAAQNISQELVLLLVLSLLTLLDGAKALRQLLISTAIIWRPRPRWSAALPDHSGGLGAMPIRQLGVGGSFQPGAEGIKQRPFAQLAGTVLLSSRRRN
jgi:hypothetical protein